ncbi:MAG TPA: sigma-70 family RNA polymerase sigma factor [Acidobacteriota bacterium]|nr:sigma-70 family RNA polymerase sigma factor [Acidobacteriota bacterium]
MQAITDQSTAMTGRPSRTLVDRAVGGDTTAFEQLYRENSGRIYALCLRMTGKPAEAEELVQQSFIRAWEKLHTFRGEARFSTWMHRLAANVIEGYRHDEIARLTGVASGTSKAQLHRARRLLREALNQ